MSISQNFPEEGPTLNLNFAGSKVLDPRITFSRSSVGTYMDANGLVVTASADSPRFDHRYVNGEIESLGLLVEEQRVNKLQYGETFNTAWSHIGFTSNAVDSTYINPTGGTGAKKLIEETGNSSGQKVLYRDITVSSNNAVYTHSCFVKPIGDRNIQLTIHNTGSTPGYFTVNFNLTAETAASTGSGSGGSLDDYGVIPYPNGWYRVYVTGNTSSNNSTGTLLRFHIRILNDSYSSNYTGDGSSGLYVYGGQMELGAFPTSLIKNSTNSDVTRTEDRAVIEGTNFTDIFDTNFESFSMFVNYDNLGISTGTNHAVVIFWGESTGYNDRIEFYKDNDAPYHIETRAFGGGSGVFANGNLSAGSTAATQKLAMSWSVPDYSNTSSRRWAFSFNGESVDVVNDGSGSTIPAVTRVGFGINPTRTDFHGKKITFKQITLYSNALTDSQLQNLTK